jgi:hypothetical protein
MREADPVRKKQFSREWKMATAEREVNSFSRISFARYVLFVMTGIR